MCPDVADKTDSGTESSVVGLELEISIKRRLCFSSTGFGDQSVFLLLAFCGLFIGLSSIPDQVTPCAALSC